MVHIREFRPNANLTVSVILETNHSRNKHHNHSHWIKSYSIIHTRDKSVLVTGSKTYQSVCTGYKAYGIVHIGYKPERIVLNGHKPEVSLHKPR